jgi:hypothetical protein
MLTRKLAAAFAFAAVVTSTGCIGNIRDTTTARTAHEILLVSTASQRAVRDYDATPLKGRKVFIDLHLFDSIDKAYVESSLRYHLGSTGVTLVDKPEECELVMEVRNGTLGIWDGDFVLGIPQLPVSAQGFPPVMLPPLYAFRRLSHQGYAKFQLWLYEPKTKTYQGRSQDLWGHCYYNQWWVFGIGPFDGSNDVFPDEDLLDVEIGVGGSPGDQGAEFHPLAPSKPADQGAKPAGDQKPGDGVKPTDKQ